MLSPCSSAYGNICSHAKHNVPIYSCYMYFSCIKQNSYKAFYTRRAYYTTKLNSEYIFHAYKNGFLI